MNAPEANQTVYIDHLIEDALSAMTAVMQVKRIPYEARLAVAKVHTALHACRSPETVARLERERGLRK